MSGLQHIAWLKPDFCRPVDIYSRTTLEIEGTICLKIMKLIKYKEPLYKCCAQQCDVCYAGATIMPSQEKRSNNTLSVPTSETKETQTEERQNLSCNPYINI
jgi:hypothetical protein